MQIDRDIKDIPLNDIDEIEWLKIRQMEDRNAEHDDLTYLGLSMATGTATPTDPSSTDSPTSWEDFLLRMSIGQLAPVRVIRYPHELRLSLPKNYGLVFGYRRWHAAKQQRLTTIKAQVIHLSIEEYRDNKIKFFLLLMGFTENAEREPLSGTEYLKAVKRLKDKYEAIYPKSSKRFKHLTQDRNTKGHFGQTNRQKPPNFNRAFRKITKKSQRRIEEDIQIADLLTSAILNDRYKEPINKSAALLLAKISHEQQIAILDQLATQHLPFTIKNIESAINQSQRQPIGIPNTHKTKDRKPTVTPDSGSTGEPHDFKHFAPTAILPSSGGAHLPDLAIVHAAITLCLDLRHRFSWTPAAIKEALPIFGDLVSTSQALASVGSSVSRANSPVETDALIRSGRRDLMTQPGAVPGGPPGSSHLPPPALFSQSSTISPKEICLHPKKSGRKSRAGGDLYTETPNNRTSPAFGRGRKEKLLMRRTPCGSVPIGPLVDLAVLVLGPLVVMAVLYVAMASRAWSKPAAPAAQPQCVYDQRDQPGCEGPPPEQAPTDQEPSR